MLAPGVLLNDRYRLDTRLATGGMGDVWRGTDLLLGRQVAVKVLLPALVAERDFIARFRAEARIMAALHHPGIVQVYDCGEHPLAAGARADYLVMEYVAGEPLSQRIESAGRLSVAQTLSVVAQAARALHAAHSGGIVHRDVKPANLLIQADGTVVLVDFGVARSAGMARITSTNAVPGTALYMAPEQAAGRPVSASTDIYALGAVAYHCLAGRPPYSGQNPLEVAIRHLHDEPPAPPADLPAPVAALLIRALAKAPTDRYPNAAAFAAAADAALATTDATTTGGGIRPAGVAAPVFSPADGMPGAATAPVVGVAGVAAGVGGGGPGTLTDLPVVPPNRLPAGSAGRRPTRPSNRRAAVVAGAATLLVGGALLLSVLGFGPGNDVPQDHLPASPTASGAAPAAGPSAGDDEDGDAPATPGRTSGAPAPGAPSAPVVTGSPTGSASPTPSATPSSAAPTTARASASPTEAEETAPPPATDGPPRSPDAPAASPANP